MGRSPCCEKNGLKKGPWTPEEDQKLVDYIQIHGYGNWRTLPKNAGLQRCGKSCRLRWTNYLRPDIKRGRFSFEEEETIIQLHSVLGNKWSAIAARLPGRTDNEIKNYWNTHIRKRLLRMGIDPVTHSPRLDLLDLSSILTSSLYNPSHQINVSRFLGVQPLVNPELLRIATSLASYQRDNHCYSVQNGHENQLSGDQIHNQFHNQPQLVQGNNDQFHELHNCSTLTSLATTSCGPFSSNETRQIMDDVFDRTRVLVQDPTVTSSDGLNSNLSDQDYFPVQSYTGYCGSDQASLVDHSPETTTASNWIGSNGNNFNFASVLSTPSSSPTPLTSNSTYINSSCSTEDEREISYCSNNLLKFEIPEFLDVSNFM